MALEMSVGSDLLVRTALGTQFVFTSDSSLAIDSYVNFVVGQSWMAITGVAAFSSLACASSKRKPGG
jgi:hypothetical protein